MFGRASPMKGMNSKLFTSHDNRLSALVSTMAEGPSLNPRQRQRRLSAMSAMSATPCDVRDVRDTLQ